MKKSDLVLAEAEEMIAKIRWSIATGKKRLVNLEYEREELEKSFPQWNEEIVKYEKEIEQVRKSNKDIV